jgi:predicted Abi (CAAX) family protease
MRNKRPVILLAVAAVILLLPFIAMQFSEEVDWSGFDFLIGAFLLLAAILAVEMTIRKISSGSGRKWITILIIVLLVLIWAELAVGLFGSPLAGS